MDRSPAAVWSRFRLTADDLGERTALEAPTVSTSFSALAATAEQAAAELARCGVRERDLVAVAVADPLTFLVGVLALFRLSAVALLASPGLGAAELRALSAGVEPDWFLAGDEPTATRIVESIGGMATAGPAGLLVVARAGPRTRPQPDDALAVVKLSSGSTAVPKAIAVEAAAVLAEADAVCDTFSLRPGERILCPVTLHHSYGFDLGVLPMLVAGVTLAADFPFVPRHALARLDGRDTAVFLGVPAMYRLLVDTPLTALPDLSRAGYLLSCTAPLSPSLITEFAARFHAPICQHYGSSETGAVTTHVRSEVLVRPQSVGRPMRGVEVGVVGGEVLVRGPALARGYLQGAPPGPSPFRDGAFATGDLGELDADGFLTLLGRRDAVINVGGHKVSPLEVQLALERHPAVREAAVLGDDDGGGNQVVRAVVALTGAATERDLIAHCRAELADYKVPRRIEVRDALPRLESGKVSLRELAS